MAGTLRSGHVACALCFLANGFLERVIRQYYATVPDYATFTMGRARRARLSRDYYDVTMSPKREIPSRRAVTAVLARASPHDDLIP